MPWNRYGWLVIPGLAWGLLFDAQARETPDHVLQEIASKGAMAVIKESLYGHNSRTWERHLAKIDSGEVAWLQVARKLYAESDGAATLGLEVALSIALTHNPEGVLRWTGEKDWPDLEKVCAVRFIESPPSRDQAQIMSVKAALSRVSDPQLQEKKQQCEKLIEADEK